MQRAGGGGGGRRFAERAAAAASAATREKEEAVATTIRQTMTEAEQRDARWRFYVRDRGGANAEGDRAASAGDPEKEDACAREAEAGRRERARELAERSWLSVRCTQRYEWRVRS